MIGASPNRIDGIEKVTGEAKFTGDISMPDLLEAKILRSPLPHALIESIDVSKAEALPGVVAVLTREDLDDIDPYYGNCLRDRAVVAIDRVRVLPLTPERVWRALTQAKQLPRVIQSIDRLA